MNVKDELLSALQAINPHIEIKHYQEKAFKRYGRAIDTEYTDPKASWQPLTEYMSSHTAVPSTGNIYVPSVSEMENTHLHPLLESNFYGNMPAQTGYCNGNNSALNALEYHKSSEINQAVTPMVLLLGDLRDIDEQGQYNSAAVEAFFLPAGAVAELYATTLHFAPCKVLSTGFKAIVVLPRGTNLPLAAAEHKPANLTCKQRTLFAANKWLLAHKENQALLKQGAWPGITGKNIIINFLP